MNIRRAEWLVTIRLIQLIPQRLKNVLSIVTLVNDNKRVIFVLEKLFDLNAPKMS